jgi:hypothetical protein
MKSINLLYRITVFLVLASFVVFFTGVILAATFGQSFPVQISTVILVSACLYVVSLPVGFSCLMMCAANGVVSTSDVVYSVLCACMFSVFGYLAVVFTLGASIKKHNTGTAPRLYWQFWPFG